jgi:hypothetical protein
MPPVTCDPALIESPAIQAKAPFAAAALICGKCSRKLGPDGKAMRKALKTALKSRRWGKARLLETRCFSLCPKRRQVLASARTLSEGRLLVVKPGFAVEAALVALLGPPRDR